MEMPTPNMEIISSSWPGLRPLASALSRATPAPSIIDPLTGIRGLAATWVVLYHFLPDLEALLPASAIASPFLGQGHFAVPMFFVLSGFLLTYRYRESFCDGLDGSTLLTFWGRRLARVYPLHLTTLLVVLAMVIVARLMGLTISERGYGARDLVLNLLLVQTWVPHFQLNWNYPSWSISSEWFAYLFFPVACLGLNRIRSPWVLGGVALLFYALSISHTLSDFDVPFREMTAVIGPFLLGCVGARAVSSGYLAQSRPEAWALVSGTALLLSPYVVSGKVVAVSMMISGMTLVLALGAAGRGCSRFWSWRPLIRLGDVSYSLYLTHTIAQKLLYEIAPVAKFVDRSWPIRIAVLGGYAIVIVLLTGITHSLLDAPIQKLLRRVRAPRLQPKSIT